MESINLLELLKNFLQENPSQLISIKIDGKEQWQHVRVETRQYLISMMNLWIKFCTTIEWDRVESECKIFDNNDLVTSWTWVADYSEPFLAKSEFYATASMAETRALGKACRNKRWYLLVQAWLQATPAEEMAFIPWASSITPALSWFKK